MILNETLSVPGGSAAQVRTTYHDPSLSRYHHVLHRAAHHFLLGDREDVGNMIASFKSVAEYFSASVLGVSARHCELFVNNQPALTFEVVTDESKAVAYA